MSVYLKDGKVLLVGGKVAVNSMCCCDNCSCPTSPPECLHFTVTDCNGNVIYNFDVALTSPDCPSLGYGTTPGLNYSWDDTNCNWVLAWDARFLDQGAQTDAGYAYGVPTTSGIYSGILHGNNPIGTLTDVVEIVDGSPCTSPHSPTVSVRACCPCPSSYTGHLTFTWIDSCGDSHTITLTQGTGTGDNADWFQGVGGCFWAQNSSGNTGSISWNESICQWEMVIGPHANVNTPGPGTEVDYYYLTSIDPNGSYTFRHSEFPGCGGSPSGTITVDLGDMIIERIAEPKAVTPIPQSNAVQVKVEPPSASPKAAAKPCGCSRAKR